MTLMIIGDHPSLNEAGAPFTNGYWRFFRTWMRKVGIDPESSDIVWANCFNTPAGSEFAFLQKGQKGALSGVPFLRKGWYFKPELGTELTTLYAAINRIKPNLILAVGEIPALILAGEQKLKFARGRVTTGVDAIHKRKLLPILHPRSIMADGKEVPPFYADLKKAAREMQTAEAKRPQRFIHMRPTLADLEDFYSEYIVPSKELSVDIETKGHIITCIGFAPSPERALVIPFFDEDNKPNGWYWPTHGQEVSAWRFVHRLLSEPNREVFGQNFSYDAQYLWREMGLPPLTWRHDTMIMHHALQPELSKGLGYLASIYTDEWAWKFMHKRKAADRSGKKEDDS